MSRTLLAARRSGSVAAPTVSISGTVSKSSALTATEGGTVTSRQWQRGNVFDGVGSYSACGGSDSGSTYTPVAADIGFSITCVSTGPGGSTRSNALIYDPTAITAVYEVFKIRPLTPGAIAAFVGSKAGVSLAQGTGAARPTASATSFGGQPGLYFDGGDILSGTVSLGSLSALRVVTAMIDATGTTCVPMELGPGYNTNDGSFVLFVNATSAADITIGSRGTVGAGAAGSTENLTAAAVISFCVTTANANGSGFLRKNGTALTLSTVLSSCAAGNYTQTTLYLGSRSASLPWTGYFGGAILIMSGSAQDSDLEDAEAYVKNGAGL